MFQNLYYSLLVNLVKYKCLRCAVSIVKFEDEKAFDKFYFNVGNKKNIGSGGEGTCFLGNDEFVYKIYDGPDEREVNPYTIYTTGDVSSDLIIFPQDVYVVNDRLVGYKTKYIPNDVFLNPKAAFEMAGSESCIIEAFWEMVAEIKRLASEKIFMYDLIGNLMFDGKHFYAIDTSEYQHLPDKCDEEIIALNIESLIEALELQLMFDENEILRTFIAEVRAKLLNNEVPRLK